MTWATSDLREMVSINLSFAQAEVEMACDRESVARALDHVRQAEAYLRILAAELDASLEDIDEDAA